MPNVLVVDDGNEAAGVELMFINEPGYKVVDDLYDADLVVFVGGEDIQPSLYGCRKHDTTHSNVERDTKEIDIYNEALAIGLPMAGICRGGQLLNALNGGTLWQDVNNHNSGKHKAWIWVDGIMSALPIEVTSVHHQMMEPDLFSEVKILLTAGESTKKAGMSHLHETNSYIIERYPILRDSTDVEAVYYPQSQCLCYQPHPEYGHKETKEVFFVFLDRYIFKKENQID